MSRGPGTDLPLLPICPRGFTCVKTRQDVQQTSTAGGRYTLCRWLNIPCSVRVSGEQLERMILGKNCCHDIGNQLSGVAEGALKLQAITGLVFLSRYKTR